MSGRYAALVRCITSLSGRRVGRRGLAGGSAGGAWCTWRRCQVVGLAPIGLGLGVLAAAIGGGGGLVSTISAVSATISGL